MNEEVTDVELVENDETSLVYQDRVDADVVIHNIDAQEKVLNRLIKYMKDQLQPQVDYYSIKQSAKPSLGLPGAEKICNIFNLVGKPILEEKVYTSQEVRYEYNCELYHKYTGKFAGSGVGCCSSLEGKYQSNRPVDIANTIKKMAYKRAFVDATLKSTMASFLFTQDLEDYYVGNTGGSKMPPDAQNRPSKARTGSGDTSGKDFPSNREYWDKYDWGSVDLDVAPPSPGYDKAKKKPKSSTESLKLYFYSLDVIPNKDEAISYIARINPKKSWEMTYGEIKVVVEALMEVEDGIREAEELTNVTDEQLEL